MSVKSQGDVERLAIGGENIDFGVTGFEFGRNLYTSKVMSIYATSHTQTSCKIDHSLKWKFATTAITCLPYNSNSILLALLLFAIIVPVAHVRVFEYCPCSANGDFWSNDVAR